MNRSETTLPALGDTSALSRATMPSPVGELTLIASPRPPSRAVAQRTGPTRQVADGGRWRPGCSEGAARGSAPAGGVLRR